MERSASDDFLTQLAADRHQTQSDLSNNPNNPDDNCCTDASRNESYRSIGCVSWAAQAQNGEHVWADTNQSGDFCYLAENECVRGRMKKKCVICKIVIHNACIPNLKFPCRLTFRESTARDYRQKPAQTESVNGHHWVHKRRLTGKCACCLKMFKAKFQFNNKENTVVQCSWCKLAYHNKSSCFNVSLMTENCTRGILSNMIIPPSWIIKFSDNAHLKSSIVKSDPTETESEFDGEASSSFPFVVKPIPMPRLRPVVVFINPKSGGNQGSKIMKNFMTLLNPRQVFNLCEGGPDIGLRLFAKVPNVRILACGGDGTVGWIMSVIDKLQIPFVPIAVLPLGTGNDLARTLNWGSGYADEPLTKVLLSVEEGRVTQLDRWNLKVSPHINASKSADNLVESDARQSESATDLLQLDVFNNYFSLGADAATAWEFHKSREANPERYNSRFKNKIYYAGLGGLDVLKRTWRRLSDYVTLECDDQSMTERLHELRPHILLFLNISRYSAGTQPWGTSSGSSGSGFNPPSINDELLEVICMTVTELATVQFGGHGTKLCQCRKAVIKTTRAIPVQVDGEPCLLKPSIITIQRRNQAQLIIKSKHSTSSNADLSKELSESCSNNHSVSVISSLTTVHLNLAIMVIDWLDYKKLFHQLDRLKKSANQYTMITVETNVDLTYVRRKINKIQPDSVNGITLNNWSFLDVCTTSRCFRVDKSQESQYFVTDICTDRLYLVTQTQDHHDRDAHSDGGSVRDLLQIEYFSNNSHNSHSVSSQLIRGGDQLSDIVGRNDIHRPFKISSMLRVDRGLLKACKENKVNEVLDWVKAGANYLSTDSSGRTCLHWAVKNGHNSMVDFLLEHGPKELIDATDHKRGQTALHKAVIYRRLSICTKLVKHGSSVLLKDSQGHTPSYLASLTHNPKLAAFLSRHEVIENMTMKKLSIAI